MNIASRLVAAWLAASSACYAAHADTTVVTFEDNFTGERIKVPGKNETVLYPDVKKWAFTFLPGIRWPDSYGNGTNWLENNGESQTYVSMLLSEVRHRRIPPELRYDPFSIQADGLHIKAGVLTPEQQAAYSVGGHRRFGSGILISRQSFQYGKFRMVAKLPSARGSWPAFWLLPAEFKWPPEIDVFEAMAWGPRSNQLHIGVVPPKGDKSGLSQWVNLGASPADGFHEYGLDWDDKQMVFLFDGKVIHTRPTPSYLREPMYMLINFAVGGSWAYNELKIGPIDSKAPERLERGADAIEADYPAEMIVKSVKVMENRNP